MPSNSCYATCAGREIHYTEWGAGHAPTVIAWHGLARTGRDMDELAGHLAGRGFRVVCPDTIGRGFSQWSPDPGREYTLEFYARIAADLGDLHVVSSKPRPDGQPVLVPLRQVAETGKASLTGTVDEVRSVDQETPRVVVVQAIPKGDRGELAVEMLTEVGVDVIVDGTSVARRAAHASRRLLDLAAGLHPKCPKQQRRDPPGAEVDQAVALEHLRVETVLAHHQAIAHVIGDHVTRSCSQAAAKPRDLGSQRGSRVRREAVAPEPIDQRAGLDPPGVASRRRRASRNGLVEALRYDPE